MNNLSHKVMANAIRALSIDAIEKANSGHPGLPLGMADVATVLFKDFFKFNPTDPTWFDRDRFVLSAGHGSMLLYSLLYLTGYEKMSMQEIKNFRQLHSLAAGHPEVDQKAGIESTTGPLGQGIANAVGMAIAESIMRAKYGKNISDHHTYAVAGDGCLMEGISYEAVSLAGHLGLGKLIVLFDDNSITIDGPTNISTSEDITQRFTANKWQVLSIDGHNYEEIFSAIEKAKSSDDRPTLIRCKTVIGYGSPNKSGKSGAHGSPLGKEEARLTKEFLNCANAPFEVNDEILQEWRSFHKRSLKSYDKWQSEYKNSAPEIKRIIEGKLPENWTNILQELSNDFIKEEKQATRKASGRILQSLKGNLHELIGGSADLTGSNHTKTNDSTDLSRTEPKGNYVNYGIREHAMAAVMNGLSLHGGFIPYGGTYLTFSDYCRPSIRLSALMQQRVIYVMTHDSIALGEDGPTHQPIEHLASLRAMPGINVFRPSDSIEAIECWQYAIENKNVPSILSLGRHDVKTLRNCYNPKKNKSAKGAYVISAETPDNNLDCCIIATGSETEIAIQAKQQLIDIGINVRVISMPCRDLFEKQTTSYTEEILSSKTQTFVIEAAASFGWEKYTNRTQNIFGIDSFGASAPANDLYNHFKITAKDISQKIVHILEKNV